MLSDFLNGCKQLLLGIKMVSRPGLRRYAVIPWLINLVVIGLFVYFASEYLIEIIGQLIPSWLDFGWVRTLVNWLVVPVLVAAGFLVSSLLANLIAAPFNALLAEKISLQLPGLTATHRLTTLQMALMAISSQAHRLVYLLAWQIPLGLLLFVPVLNIIAGPLWLVINGWLIALEYLDYPLGLMNLSFKQQREMARRRRSLVFGYGASTLVLTAIPVLNLFVMPAAVAGACLVASQFDATDSKTASS